jgi:hypothetical protein
LIYFIGHPAPCILKESELSIGGGLTPQRGRAVPPCG